MTCIVQNMFCDDMNHKIILQNLDHINTPQRTIWDIYFDINFEKNSKEENEILILTFFSKIKKSFENKNEWCLNSNNTVYPYDHYVNNDKNMFVIVSIPDKDKNMILIYIGHKNKYTFYLKDENQFIFNTDESSKYTVYQTNGIGFGIIGNSIWNVENKIIAEIQDTGSPIKNNCFYLICHKDKKLLEVFNGNHWIFKLATVSDDILSYKNYIKSNATSALSFNFEINDAYDAIYRSEDIFNNYPGELIYYASPNEMYLNIDNNLLIDNKKITSPFDASIYSPNHKSCNIIKELGYDLSMNYDLILISKQHNIYPKIYYRNDRFQRVPEISHIPNDITIEYISKGKIIKYNQYNYVVMLKNNELIVKHNNKFVFICTFSQVNYDVIYLRVNVKAYNRFITNIPDSSEKELFKILVHDSKKINAFLKDLFSYCYIGTTYYILLKLFSKEKKSIYLSYNNTMGKEAFNFFENVYNQTCDIIKKTSHLKYIHDINFNEKTLQLNINKYINVYFNKSLNLEHNITDPILKCEKSYFITRPDPTNDDNNSKTINLNINSNEKTFDINLKIDLENKKIIINSDNNTSSLVEIDLKTQNKKSITTVYKYGFIDRIYEKIIIELGLFDDSIIVSTPSKNRTNKCIVNKIYNAINNEQYQCANGKYMKEFKYILGSEIEINDFTPGSNVCCPGIHFCHSVQELDKNNW